MRGFATSLRRRGLLTFVLALGCLPLLSATSLTASTFRGEMGATTANTGSVGWGQITGGFGGVSPYHIEVPASLRSTRETFLAASAFRTTVLRIGDGHEGRMLVLFAAVVRDGRVVAVQESRPFRARDGMPVYDVPLFPDGWERNGYLPGRYHVTDNQFVAGDEFLQGNELIQSSGLVAEMRVGRDVSKLERASGVSLKGRDTLLLGVVPADPSEREATAAWLTFIVGHNGFSP